MAKSSKASSQYKKNFANLVLAKGDGTAFSIPTAVTSRRDILENRLPVGAIGRISAVDPTSSQWSYENMRTAADELVAAIDGNKASCTITRKIAKIAALCWEIGYFEIYQQIADLSTLDSHQQNKLLNIIQELRVTHGMENITHPLVAELSSIEEAKVQAAYTSYHSASKGSRSTKSRRKKYLRAECAQALNILAKAALPGGSIEEQRLLELIQLNANAYETNRGAEKAKVRECRDTQKAEIATLRKDVLQLRANGNEEEAAKKQKRANELYSESINGKDAERMKKRRDTQKAEIATLRKDVLQLRANGNEEEAAKKQKRANELYSESINGKDAERMKKRRDTQKAEIATLRKDVLQLRANGNEEEAAKKQKCANELYSKSITGKHAERSKKRRANNSFCRAPSGEVLLERDVFAGIGPYLSGMELVSGKITSLTKEEKKTGEELMSNFANHLR